MFTPSIQYQPLLVLETRSNGIVTCNDANLTKILETVQDTHLSIVTICGPRGSGKSLLVGCILKYLQNQTDSEWLDSSGDYPIREFKWPLGSSPEGPSLWGFNPPIAVENVDPSKPKTSLLILYTHISQDILNVSLNPAIVRLMGMTFTMSSHIVFNIHKEITEEAINTFCSYLKDSLCFSSGVTSADTKLSQVSFLVRDSNPSNKYSYGGKGGTDYLKLEKLKPKEEHSRSSKENRNLIQHFVKDMYGFLLPYPGHKAIESNCTEVNLEDMETIFLEEMKQFVENLVSRAASNEKLLTGKQFWNNFQICVGLGNVIGMSPDDCECLKSANISVLPTPMEQDRVIQEAVKKFVLILRNHLKGKKYLENGDLRNIEKKARQQVDTTFKDEVQRAFHGFITESGPPPPNVLQAVKKMHQKLNERLNNQLERFKQGNSQKKLGCIEQLQLELLQQYTNDMSTWSVRNHPNREETFKRDSQALIRDLVKDFETTSNEDGDSFKEKLLEEETILRVGIFGRKTTHATPTPVPRPRRH